MLLACQSGCGADSRERGEQAGEEASANASAERVQVKIRIQVVLGEAADTSQVEDGRGTIGSLEGY